MRRFALGVLSVLVSAVAFGCSEAEPEEPWTDFELRGVVVDLRPGEPNVAVIEHEEIEGFMKAMTMGFPVRDAEEFAKLSDGAAIHAVLKARGYAEYYIEGIEVVEPPAEEGPADPSEAEPSAEPQ